jgi:hypothetical protein
MSSFQKFHCGLDFGVHAVDIHHVHHVNNVDVEYVE